MANANLSEINGETWFYEYWRDAAGGLFKVDKMLHEINSEHQNILVFENGLFGRMLAIDNVIQVTERDEHIYHEMMAHTPILAHGAAKRVLIIGGGDGGLIREIFRHKSVEHVTLVEIDQGVIDLCQEWMPGVSGDAFDDPRLNLIVGDGAAFVAETENRFDVVIVDSTDPTGPGAVLFTEAFYRGCQRCLNEGGVVVTMSGLPFVQDAEFRDAYANLSTVFKNAGGFQIVVPGFWGGPMILGFISDSDAPFTVSVQSLQERFAAANFDCKYYSPQHHKAAFHLPEYIFEKMPHAKSMSERGLL